jgi:hypothetical protein
MLALRNIAARLRTLGELYASKAPSNLPGERPNLPARPQSGPTRGPNGGRKSTLHSMNGHPAAAMLEFLPGTARTGIVTTNLDL